MRAGIEDLNCLVGPMVLLLDGARLSAGGCSPVRLFLTQQRHHQYSQSLLVKRSNAASALVFFFSSLFSPDAFIFLALPPPVHKAAKSPEH